MLHDLDHNTVHKLRAMLNGESEDHRDEARRLLGLVTNNKSVVDLMGSAPQCAALGCQLRISTSARPDLSFAALRAANVQRCEASWHPIAAWSSMKWGCATAGEVGEACNLAKKLERIDDQHAKGHWNKPEDREPADLVQRLAHEVADVVIYADLWLARHHMSLGDAVRGKFNAKSMDIGSPVLL